MDEYPPITGELRAKLAEYKPTEEGHTLTTYPVGQTGYARLVELCDTIDAIHARLEAAYDRLRAERDSMAAALDRAEGEHEYAPESHYVMLPKDADGELVYLGDVMEVESMTFCVASIDYGQHPDIGDGMFWMLWSADGCVFERADQCRHRTLTVEDVLREFAAEFNRDDSELCDEEIIERFATKLRLAGDAE